VIIDVLDMKITISLNDLKKQNINMNVIIILYFQLSWNETYLCKAYNIKHGRIRLYNEKV